jgi:uncharacterized membrane protein YgdD (TMEM256/DUF423 family)
MSHKAIQLLRVAALSGLFTVGLGAFGAHGLKPLLTEYQVMIFEKGIQYQFVHTLALALAGLLLQNQPENANFSRAGWAFLFGAVCFSGSLYLLACRDLLPFSVAWAGPVTPLGGLGFMAGWLLLFLGLRK